jgi:hypothetical protein
VTGTLPTANGGTNLTSFTSGGVVYASSSSALATGSALTYDGSVLRNLQSSGTNAWFRATSGTVDTYFGAATSGLGTVGVVGTFSANDLTFYQNSAEGMRLTSTGLGIGTSSPTAKLHVLASSGICSVISECTVAGNNAQFISKTTTRQWNIGGNIVDSSTGTLEFYDATAAATRMRLDSSGNLGLGVTPSAWNSVYRCIQAGSGAAFAGRTDNVAWTELLSNAYRDAGGGYTYLGTQLASTYKQEDGVHKWSIAASGTGGTAIAFTQAMTLDANGALLLGTTSTTPANANGVIAFGGSDAGIIYLERQTGTDQLRFYTGGNRLGYVNTASSTLTIGTANYPLAFSTNDTERARIDSSGNLLVGTTSVPYSNNTAGVAIRNNSSIGQMLIGKTASGNTTAVFFAFGTTLVGSITYSDTATAYNTSSDYRLKNTIAPMTGALAKVALLKPCTYKWNADGSDGEGFIAHELAEVVPQAVSGEKDALDADGNIKPQGIDTSFLVATLTAAIQEQQAMIESLKARLDAANL